MPFFVCQNRGQNRLGSMAMGPAVNRREVCETMFMKKCNSQSRNINVNDIKRKIDVINF